MKESIIALDRSLFRLINQDWVSRFLDELMPIITNERIWLPLIFASWFYLFFAQCGKRRGLALMLLVGVGATDIISSHFIKKTVRRQRPCITEPDARMLICKKRSMSFPSSHAANTSAFAWILILSQGVKVGLPFGIIALSVAYSRVYVGVHYPFDALAGIILGLITALITIRIGRRFQALPEPEQSDTHPQPPSLSTE